MSTEQLLSSHREASSSTSAAIQAALDKREFNTDGMIPAIVESYDRKENVATVRPVIQIIRQDKKVQSRHPLTKINVLALGGGGFVINFPLKKGDLGWIFAADRDIGLFKQNLAEAKPNSHRAKAFADGLFIPDIFRKYTISAGDEDAMVIQAVGGATKIVVHEKAINITVDGNMTVKATKAVFDADVEVKKTLTVTGNSTLAKTSVEGKDVGGHKHTDPQGGDVGPMKN